MLATVSACTAPSSIKEATTGESANDFVAARKILADGSTRLDVAFAAYRGELRLQGVDGFQSFCQQLKWGQLAPETVAQAAVRAGLLSADASDKDWMWQFKLAMQSVCR